MEEKETITISKSAAVLALLRLDLDSDIMKESAYDKVREELREAIEESKMFPDYAPRED